MKLSKEHRGIPIADHGHVLAQFVMTKIHDRIFGRCFENGRYRGDP